MYYKVIQNYNANILKVGAQRNKQTKRIAKKWDKFPFSMVYILLFRTMRKHINSRELFIRT